MIATALILALLKLVVSVSIKSEFNSPKENFERTIYNR